MKNKKDLLYDLESDYSATDYYLESERRDVYYSALVKDIVKNNRTGQVLKCIFFIVVCLVFAFICVFGLLIIFNISKRENISYSDIGVAITGFGSVLSSIIVLPQIIAKHLFPENSEEVRFGFIKENQKLDQAYLEDDVSDLYEDFEEDEDINDIHTNLNAEDEQDIE
ncbi:MAG: hypothetical protein IJB57_00810 [Clostridia bacterium]|nr:hypothetical protein [Clostridia bacterium]